MVSEAGVDEELCQSLLASYVSEHSASYPLGIGADMDGGTRSQLVIYLVSPLRSARGVVLMLQPR